MEVPAVLLNIYRVDSRYHPDLSLWCDAAASLRGQCEDFLAAPPEVCVAAT